MGDVGTYEEIFKIAIHAESTLAKFYKELTIRFKDSETGSFFKEMAQDEIDHMKKLNEMHGSLSTEVLHSPADPAILEEGRRAEGIKILERLESIETVEGAYKEIKEIESSEINTMYLFFLSKFIDVDEKREFLNSELKA
ncbi:MAG: ferritin family protein, partial [Candidatus Hydrothermarchaeales archaeon]